MFVLRRHGFLTTVAISLITVVIPAGCGGSSANCQPPAGGRCAGPQALEVGQGGGPLGVAITPDGRTITAVVLCGGSLRVRESTVVRLTWIASAVGAGGMSCAMVPLTVTLHAPLGTRPLVDGASSIRLHPRVCVESGAALLRRCS